MAADTDWWAIHVFLFDPSAGEACLLDDVMPALRGLLAEGRVSGWFFLRYWEGGPHLRVRLTGLGQEDRRRLLEDLQAKVALRRSATVITRDEYYGQHAFDGEPVDVDALPWYGDGQVVEIEYVPETVRYGGPEALRLSERMFRTSSELAVGLISATRDDFGKRMSAAFVLMVAVAGVARNDGIGMTVFCEQYAAMWSRHSEHSRGAAATELPPPSRGQVAAVAEMLSGRPSSSAFARRWYDALSQFREQLERLGQEGRLVSPMDGEPALTPERIEHAIIAILWSQLHMLNNRLAILPAQEVVLARMVAAAARNQATAEAVSP